MTILESWLAAGKVGFVGLTACCFGFDFRCGLGRGSRFRFESGVGAGRPLCAFGIEVSLLAGVELTKHNPIIESVITPMRLGPKIRNLRFIFSTNTSLRLLIGDELASHHT